jgi:glycosyltransferase involved in cell wall biosynthesis
LLVGYQSFLQARREIEIGSAAETLRVVHVVAGLDAAHGGPSHTVPRFCAALSRLGSHIELLSVDGKDEPAGKPTETDYDDHRFAQDYIPVPVLRDLRFSGALASSLRETARRADVIHDHGIWLMPNLHAGWAARAAGKPLVVSPRGMLAPAALAFSRRRKQAFWCLLQGPAIRHAACFHATSEQEYEEIRCFGVSSPVAIIPNGVDLSALSTPSSPVGDRTVLSLGRLHPKKGLDRLLQAWAEVEGRYPDWRLKIIGPAEHGYDQVLRASAAALGLTRVSVEGPVYGEAKLRAYQAADLFVLPTLNENFGQTVAEALMSEVPVIVTKGAPWSGLETQGCGWWIAHGVEPLVAALRQAMDMPRSTLKSMGAKGREWMAQDFSWERVAQEMLAVYRWLAFGDNPPSVVRFD